MTNIGKALIWIAFAITISIIVLILTEEKRFRVNHAAYTTGTVIGIGRNGRGGAQYVNYSFQVDGKFFTGWVTKESCPACTVEASVKIMYAEGNPKNSEIIP
jgi:hypothetical protein